MNSRVLTYALIGLLVGVLIGEFFPDITNNLGKDIGAAFSKPFGEYRNKLAIRYGLGGAVIGALVALISSRKK